MDSGSLGRRTLAWSVLTVNMVESSSSAQWYVCRLADTIVAPQMATYSLYCAPLLTEHREEYGAILGHSVPV